MFSPVPSNRYWKHHLAHATVAALLLLAAPARADEKCLVGTWVGTLKEKGNKGVSITPIKVAMSPTLDQFPEDSMAPDGKGHPPVLQQYIRFAPPIACRLTLFFAGRDDEEEKDLYYVTMTNASGGMCNNLNNLQIQLECLDGKLRASIPATKTSAAKKLELTRSK